MSIMPTKNISNKVLLEVVLSLLTSICYVCGVFYQSLDFFLVGIVLHIAVLYTMLVSPEK